MKRAYLELSLLAVLSFILCCATLSLSTFEIGGAAPLPAPSAGATAEHVDPKIEAAAREWLRRFQTGDIDISQLNPQMRSQLTQVLVQQLGSVLKPLGDPTDFSFVGTRQVEGGIVYEFVASFATLKIDEAFALAPDGKIAGIYFKSRINFDDVKGPEVEKAIVDGLIPFVKSQNASLQIGAAKCPADIDLTKGSGHCTLSVEGVDLPIHVVASDDQQHWAVNFDGSFYQRTDIEAFVKSYLLSDYGISATARCEGGAVSVMDAGVIINCSIAGTTNVKAVTLKTQPQGKGFYVYPIPSVSSVLPFIDSAAVAHKRGEAATLSGQQLNEFVNHWVATEGLKPGAQLTIGKARCPDPADLSGSKDVMCLVSFDAQDVRYKIWIDDVQGFRVDVLDAVIGKAKVEQFAEEAINKNLQESGATPAAAVDCGERDVIVVPVSGDFFLYRLHRWAERQSSVRRTGRKRDGAHRWLPDGQRY